MLKTKETFSLLKDIPNIISLTTKQLDAIKITGNGVAKAKSVLELLDHRITHFGKDRVFSLISKPEKINKFVFIYLHSYPLTVLYNAPTKQVLINLAPFGTDNITSDNPDPRNIYASMIYGLVLSDIIEEKIKINDKYATVIISFLMTVFVRLFGKEYGLLGYYSTEINKLKFLLSCYIYSSFFGLTGKELYRNASFNSAYNYQELITNLEKYDFTNIDDFIKSLNDFKVMPGINKYLFSAKILKLLTINFIPAIEDGARFVAFLTTSTIPGNSIAPQFISKYNITEYNKIINLTKSVFMKKEKF